MPLDGDSEDAEPPSGGIGGGGAGSYDGQWVADLPSGDGRLVCDPPPLGSGEVYEGQWLRGERHGTGTCFYLNGDCYVGDWRHGRRQGTGSLAHTAPPRDGG